MQDFRIPKLAQEKGEEEEKSQIFENIKAQTWQKLDTPNKYSFFFSHSNLADVI